MMRQILGVLAGYITTMGTVRVAQGALFFLAFSPFGPIPAGHSLPAACWAGLLAFSFAAAVLGGRLAAAVGKTPHVARYLGIVILAMGVLSVVLEKDRQLLWFDLLLPVACAATAFAAANQYLRSQPSSL